MEDAKESSFPCQGESSTCPADAAVQTAFKTAREGRGPAVGECMAKS